MQASDEEKEEEEEEAGAENPHFDMSEIEGKMQNGSEWSHDYIKLLVNINLSVWQFWYHN